MCSKPILLFETQKMKPFCPYVEIQWGPKSRSARINISVPLKKDSSLPLLLKIRLISFRSHSQLFVLSCSHQSCW